MGFIPKPPAAWIHHTQRRVQPSAASSAVYGPVGLPAQVPPAPRSCPQPTHCPAAPRVPGGSTVLRPPAAPILPGRSSSSRASENLAPEETAAVEVTPAALRSRENGVGRKTVSAGGKAAGRQAAASTRTSWVQSYSGADLLRM